MPDLREAGSKPIEPQAIFVKKNKAYVLFDTFENAYAIWERIISSPETVVGILPEYLEDATLKTVNATDQLPGEDPAELKISKITDSYDTTLYIKPWNHERVIKQFQGSKIVPKGSITEYRVETNNNCSAAVTTVTFKFKTLENILIAYQKIKRFLKDDGMTAEATITPQLLSNPGQCERFLGDPPDDPPKD